MIPSSSSSHVVFGAGPVARSVVASLTARGVRPVVVTRSGVKIPDSVSVRADISDVSAATVVLAGAEVVYQCAQPAYQCWPQEFPALQASVLHAARSSERSWSPPRTSTGTHLQRRHSPRIFH